jgi:hypothetical protein
MSMSSKAAAKIAGMVTTGLLATLPARAVTFDFDSGYTAGSDLNGQSVWSANPGGIQVSSGGLNGSQYAGYGTVASTATAWAVGQFGGLTGSETVVLQYNFYVGNSPGVTAGLGWDNSTGHLDVNADPLSQWGLGLRTSDSGSGNVTLQLSVNGGSGTSAAYAFDTATWGTVRMTLNLSANSGQGSASVFIKSASASSFFQVAGLQNIGLSLNQSGMDGSNPKRWNTVWLSESGPSTAGPSAGLDSIIAVPEPGSWALVLTGLTGFVLVVRRPRA